MLNFRQTNFELKSERKIFFLFRTQKLSTDTTLFFLEVDDRSKCEIVDDFWVNEFRSRIKSKFYETFSTSVFKLITIQSRTPQVMIVLLTWYRPESESEFHTMNSTLISISI